MGRFVYFKSDPCPGCGRKNDGCKQSQDERLILCLRVHSAADTPEGLHFQKVSGAFGQLIRKDNQAGGVVFPFRPKESKPEPETKRLSIVERASGYRKLADQLSLDEPSQAWLEKKGLPREAALRLGFKSYTPETRVSGLSPLLPGVNPANPSRLLPEKAYKDPGGLLLPMRDVSGAVLGYQRVLPRRIKVELSGGKWDGDKYFWFSSMDNQGESCRGGIPRLPKPYDHLPLGFFKPETLNPAYTNALILAEGPLKCAIASELGGLQVLATPAGGRFTRDNGELYLQLVETIRELNHKRVILAPDAGMTLNHGLSKAYFDLFKALEAIGIELEILWWNQLTKAYEDIDELVLAGKLAQAETITYDQYYWLHDEAIKQKLDKQRAKGFRLRIKREAPVLKAPAVSLEARRQEIRQELEQVIRYADPGTLHVFQDGCGTGKTYAVLEILKEAKRQKWLKGRRVALTKTIDQAQALKDQLGDDAFFMGGRSSNPKSDFYCSELGRFNALAEAGHDATSDFCLDCSARREAMGDPCPFKQAEKQAGKAKIVTSTYGSFLSDSLKLDTFTLVVIDESVIDSGLTLELKLTPAILASWKQAIIDHCPERYPRSSHPIWPLFDALQIMLNKAGDLERDQCLDAGEMFKALYGDDLKPLFEAEWGEAGKGKAFHFETLHRNHTEFPDLGKLQKRLLVDLLEALTDGKQRADLTRGGIVFERPRAALNILKSKVVINLDATPPLELLADMWGAENVKTYGQGGIPANVHVTQVDGRLFSPHTIEKNPRQLRDLEAIANHYADQFKAPLVVSQRDLSRDSWLKEGKIPEAAKVLNINNPKAESIWYGNQTRAANNYQHCDALILAGPHQPPPDAIRRKVNALRQSQPGLNQSEKQPVGMALVGNSFSVPSREQWQHADPLVQSVINNHIAGEVFQAIGRLRALLRLGILNVVFISSLILPGVPVDEVIEASSILDPEGQRRKRPHLHAGNQAAAGEALAKVEAYLAEHPGASIRAIMAGTGLASGTVQKHLKALRESLPPVSPMPVLDINTTMSDTPGKQTESQSQPITVLEQAKDPEYPDILIPASGLPCIPSVSVQWLDDGTYKLDDVRNRQLDEPISLNEVKNGTRDAP